MSQVTTGFQDCIRSKFSYGPRNSATADGLYGPNLDEISIGRLLEILSVQSGLYILRIDFGRSIEQLKKFQKEKYLPTVPVMRSFGSEFF